MSGENSTNGGGGEQGGSWKESVEQGISTVASSVASGIIFTRDALSTSYSTSVSAYDTSKEYLQIARKQLGDAEDTAVEGAKSAIAWGQENPNAALPALGTGFLLLLPGTRRMLWRKTFGRLRDPDSMLKNSADQVQRVHAHVNEHASQLGKLQERMLAAEAEYKSGYSKLKSTRVELQRLAGNVVKDEKTANRVVQELRALKSMNASLSLRAEAASHLAQLKSQRNQLNKNITRIANRDI